ncbi:NAD-dependent epimerase/dehydratase family protein [Belliella kenyensis]|uniref:NAD-dependent epimerase/dehydratase family protein n=1 Tax=Belliella kenyensis TaxID=1472724 RepID=A0ABV8EFB2_9BACT|nr:NAD-dependent epimerase/dehydratase family protein [Belliella kenyensis]MCH7401715.1 NAD-dependent epimerase/dehydratase family protein [Belliella kenyensis]MDN3604215.1 NAD-dependent epimerase/dehydratase family protein [Belliella kenyensis]
MTIVVSGATGFIGSNLIPYIQNLNYEVLPVSLRNQEWPNQIKIDASCYIHLAGKAHDHKKEALESDYFYVNFELTKDFFNSFIKSNANLFIHISSMAAVEEYKSNSPLNEKNSCNPVSNYGKSKRKAEEFLLSQVLPEGKKMILLRPPMVHGPGDKGNLNLLFNVVKKGIPWPLASFENKRSFLNVDNFNYIIASILRDPYIQSGVYNLSDDEAVSTNELIKLISIVSGNKARLWKIPPFFINGLAKIGDKLGLPLNTERLKKLTENYEVSNSKLKAALNIEKLPNSAMEGLVKTLKSF